MAVPPSAIKKLKTNTRDYTQTAVIVLIKYGVFRAQDVDDAIAAVNSKNTWIAPSNLPDYDDSIENDIIIGKQNPTITKIRNIIAAHYGINLEEEELVEETQELIEDTSEQEENKKSPPSTLVVSNISKKQVSEDDLVEEEIDERILRILGLEDVFDIDYETYISLLKEKLISSRMTDSKLFAEEDELIREEFKRVKGKVGRFKPKRKTKIDVSNLTGISLLKPADKKQSGEESSEEEQKRTSIFDGILNILETITGTVDNIYSAISLNNSLLNNQLEFDRRESERLRRGGEEERLETKKDGFLKKAKKILAPFESIFDRILRFLVFTILGRAFKLFMDWASDPENRKKLETIGKFLKDWWPALLGAWFFFANPLGSFIRTIVGTVAKLTFKLAKFAIPKLLKFVAANPKAFAVAAAIGGGAYLATKVTGQQEAAPIQAENKAKAQRGKTLDIRGTDTAIDKSPSVGDMGPSTPFGLLQGVNTGGIIKPLIQGVSNGGSVFSGLVDKDTGETVSGAGPDTQFLPVEDGGGAVLQRGEVVLQKGARERMIKQAGVDPLAFNVGSNANKPRKINADTLASSGGLIGLSNGGEIGGSAPAVNNPNFWITAAIAGKEAGHIPQGQADVAQSIYNRAKVGIYPGGKDIRKIITAPGQYEPTFGNPGGWNAIKDRNSAINVVKEPKLIDMAAKSITNSSLQRSAASYIGSRTDFQGESQKPYMKPSKGDITRGKNHNFFGWFTDNGYNSRLSGPSQSPFSPMSQGTSQKQTENKKQPSIMDRIGGIGSSLSGFANRIMGKQGGGTIVKESDGIKNPHSSTDNRAFPIFDSNKIAGIAGLQVGEGIVPRDVMQNIGQDNFNRFIAMFESGRDSNAAKLGYTKPKVTDIGPPIRGRGGIAPITLPPISQSSGNVPTSSTSGTQVPPFATVSSAAMSVRINNADTYGITG
jgi:hypothetical protein